MNKQIISFILTGSINTLFYYLLYSLLLYLDINYKLAVLFATIIGMFFSFKTFSQYVFTKSDKWSLYKFISVYVLLYILNIFFISLFEKILQNYYISGLIATLICAILSFVLNKKFVFQN